MNVAGSRALAPCNRSTAARPTHTPSPNPALRQWPDILFKPRESAIAGQPPCPVGPSADPEEALECMDTAGNGNLQPSTHKPSIANGGDTELFPDPIQFSLPGKMLPKLSKRVSSRRALRDRSLIRPPKHLEGVTPLITIKRGRAEPPDECPRKRPLLSTVYDSKCKENFRSTLTNAPFSSDASSTSSESPDLPFPHVSRDEEGFLTRGVYSALDPKRPRRPFNFALPMAWGEAFINQWQLGFDIPTSWKPVRQGFTLVDCNRYQYNLPNKSVEQDAICQCSDGCGEKCINRLTFIECPETDNHRCQNQRIMRSQGIRNLDVLPCGRKGWGLFTRERIVKNQYIIEYCGEVITRAQFSERMVGAADTKHFYFLDLGNDKVIDAGRSGSLARFVNHSCSPNCRIEKWVVNGQPRAGLFANEDIELGAELSYDYQFEIFEDRLAQKCFCGSLQCRSVISRTRKRDTDDGDDASEADFTTEEDEARESYFERKRREQKLLSGKRRKSTRKVAEGKGLLRRNLAVVRDGQRLRWRQKPRRTILEIANALDSRNMFERKRYVK